MWPLFKRFLLAITAVLLLVTGLAASFYLYVEHKTFHAPRALHRTVDYGDPHALLAEANRLSWLENWANARPLYTQAERLFHSHGDTRNELYAKVGRIRSESESMSIVDVSRMLADVLRDPVVLADPKLKLWCLAAKGRTDLNFDPPSAKKVWNEARSLAVSLGETQWEARARGELGVIAFLQGDTSRAVSLVGKALLSAMVSGDTAAQIRYLDMLGDGFDTTERYTEALRFFDRAIHIAESTQDSPIPLMAYEGKAEALVALGRTWEAKQLLEHGLAEARANRLQGHETEILRVLGRVALQNGDRALATKYFEQAADLGTRLEFFRLVAEDMFELAELYAQSGELDKAEDRLSVALDASRRVADRYFLPRDLKVMAELAVRRGDTARASRLYAQAEDVIDGLSINVHDRYYKNALAGAQSDVYIEHFKLLAHGKNVAAAFGVIERVRGKVIVANLQGGRKQTEDDSPQSAPLETELSDLQVKLMRSDDPRERTELLDKIAERERRLAFVRNEFTLSRRELIEKTARLVDIQNILGADELLLEYVLAEPHSYCIAVLRSASIILELAEGRRKIEELTATYRTEIEAKKNSPELEHELYSILLEPVPEYARRRRLIVVPDGKLFLLPFESLRDQHGQYVLSSSVVSFTPAATLLHSLRVSRNKQMASLPFLGLGDVVYEAHASSGPKPNAAHNRGASLLRELSDLTSAKLYNLPHTRDEVLSVGKIMGSKAVLLLGQNATETSFKSQPLGDFKILHLAVHAAPDEDDPDRAALVLGADPASHEDGLLQAREINDLRLNAELVTLSACSTGVGKLQGETGVRSLVEAFLVGGAKSVVASLWSVDDTYATTLMKHFYQHLAEGQDKASALRQAKLDLLEQYGDQPPPFYWAGFTITGEAALPISKGD